MINQKNKKATEKPIEIFVALFVILAVAMVLLKMFSGQIADKSNELNQFSDRQAALGKCDELCAATKTNNCRVEDQIRFCTTNFGLDLDGNSYIGDNNEYPYSICEDTIYCPLVNECECGRKLNMKNCVELLQEYARENIPGASGTITSSEINDYVNSKLIYKKSSSSCSTPSSNSWTTLFVKDLP